MVSPRPLRILIPGGTGHLGRILARHFHERGQQVTVLGRHARQFEWPSAIWDGLELGDWTSLVDGIDVVINLAGRNVDCRHTTANKREIKHSRVITTQLVGQAIAQAKRPPALWLNASTVSIYKHSIDRAMDDVSGELGADEVGVPRKWRYTVDVAESWERTLFAAATPHTRRVAMRTGVVMSPEEGGAFARFLELVRLGMGGTAGTGKQFVSWIHDVDFVRAVEFLIGSPELSGAVNLCSPCPLPNQEFMRCLRRAWCTTYVGLPLPRWLLECGAVLMRRETELLLKSRRVVPRRLLNAGFEFHFPNWRGATQDLVCRWRECSGEEQVSAAAL